MYSAHCFTRNGIALCETHFEHLVANHATSRRDCGLPPPQATRRYSPPQVSPPPESLGRTFFCPRPDVAVRARFCMRRGDSSGPTPRGASGTCLERPFRADARKRIPPAWGGRVKLLYWHDGAGRQEIERFSSGKSRRAHLRFVHGADQIHACIIPRGAHGGARRPRRAVLAGFPDLLSPSTPARRGRLAPPGALPSNQGAPKVEAEGRRVHKPEMRPIRARARNNRLEEGRGVA